MENTGPRRCSRNIHCSCHADQLQWKPTDVSGVKKEGNRAMARNRIPVQVVAENVKMTIYGGKLSQLSHGPCCRCSGIFRSVVHDVKTLRRSFPENRRKPRQVGRQERTVPNPVIIQMAVDGSNMVWKVDISTGHDHRDQTEENGI